MSDEQTTGRVQQQQQYKEVLFVPVISLSEQTLHDIAEILLKLALNTN